MQISSILDIVNGELLNSPFISFIYAIKTEAKQVKEGDLFISNNALEIELAVKNGAFGILSDIKNLHIGDEEIAWIKVEDISKAIIQLIRFKLATLELESFYCDKASYDFFKIFHSYSDKNIVLIPNKIEKLFKFIDDISYKDILIAKDKKLLDKIYPNNKQFIIKNDYEVKNLIEHSLFETSFSYKDIFFSKLKIPSIYINTFLSIYEFLNHTFDINKLKNFYNFKPIFLDKKLNLTEFGKSDRFLICQNDVENIKKEVNFLNQKYNYAKTIFISSHKIEFIKNQQIILEDINSLKSTLKRLDFNAVYLIGFDYEQIHAHLTQIEEEQTLF